MQRNRGQLVQESIKECTPPLGLQSYPQICSPDLDFPWGIHRTPLPRVLTGFAACSQARKEDPPRRDKHSPSSGVPAFLKPAE